jgi:hypothetical protein
MGGSILWQRRFAAIPDATRRCLCRLASILDAPRRHLSRSVPLCLLLIALAAIAPRSIAHTYRVELDGSGDFTSIEQAILACYTGDEVVVGPGTYHERLLFTGVPINVHSRLGPAYTVVDADSLGSVASMIFGEPPSTILNGFVLRHGIGTELDFPKTDSPETADPAQRAGGEDRADIIRRFLAEGPSFALRQNVPPPPRGTLPGEEEPAGGRQFRYGGGLLLLLAGPTLINLKVEDNRADMGGGLYGNNSTPVLKGCQFGENVAGRGAGGLLELCPQVQFQQCAWDGNYSALGGGLALFSSAARLVDCSFQRNDAGEGGALFLLGTIDLLTAVSGTVFWKNTAGVGAAIRVSETGLDLHGCTFARNGGDPADSAVVLYNEGCPGRLDHCIFAGNAPRIDLFCSGAQVSSYCTDFWNPAGSGEACPLQASDFALDPRFCNLDRGDLHLREDSPCRSGVSPQNCGLVGALDVECPAPTVKAHSRDTLAP